MSCCSQHVEELMHSLKGDGVYGMHPTHVMQAVPCGGHSLIFGGRWLTGGMHVHLS